MNISDNGICLIKDFEGFRDEAYQDSRNIWTIGFGTIKYPDGTPVKQHDCCTPHQAEEFIRKDLERFVNGLNKRIAGISLTQQQFDSLCSFCYNLGLRSLDQSTLLKKIKINPNDKTIYQYNKEHPADSCEFTKWIRCAGKPIKGLLLRRMREADVYGE